MADQLTVLQLVLDHLNVGNDISTIEDRIAIQKVVCLAQEAGMQLGYGFSWYVRGPYSTSLTNDYYQIAAARSSVEKSSQNFELTTAAIKNLEKVKSIINPTADVPLNQVQWLELLASTAFLIRRYRLPNDKVEEKLKLTKPSLHPYFENAISALRTVKLVE